MTIKAIRLGLAKVVTDATINVGGTVVTASAYYPNMITDAWFAVGEYDITTSIDFANRNDSYVFTTYAFVPAGDDKGGQEALDEMLERQGDNSLRAAIDAAAGGPGEYALNGACDDVYTTAVRNYRRYTFGVKTFYGAQLMVFAIGAGAE